MNIMNKITESTIEKFAIKLLKKQGYQYLYGPNIAPDSDTPERNAFENVLLPERLKTAVGRINPLIPADAKEDAIRQIRQDKILRLVYSNNRLIYLNFDNFFDTALVDLPFYLGNFPYSISFIYHLFLFKTKIAVF